MYARVNFPEIFEHVLTTFSFWQKNEMEKEFLKLQEAHEGQQALLQKLQVSAPRKWLPEN